MDVLSFYQNLQAHCGEHLHRELSFSVYAKILELLQCQTLSLEKNFMFNQLYWCRDTFLRHVLFLFIEKNALTASLNK